MPRVKIHHIALRLGLPLVFAVAWGLCAISSATQTSNQSRHVVVVVWDGMRPDFVSEQNTPTLWKLAHEGVTFRNHHSVYPSATNVNGTALITGVYPGKNGIIANHVYRPDIDSSHAIDVENPAVVKRGDELSGGKYVSLSTIAELVRRAGGRTIIASAKTVGLLLDRSVGHASGLTSADGASGTHAVPSQAHVRNSVTLFAGKSLPGDVLAPITDMLGPFPSGHVQQDAWTTKAVTDSLLKDGVPTLSILWLGEPDLTQHESAPGAPAALTAIKSADENLAAVLSALDRQKARETTDLFVVSDHGFSTIRRSIDLRKILNDAGFRAKTQFAGEPKTGDIMLAGNGGSVLFYVIGHDETLTRRLIEFLQQSDFAGVIFTRKPLQGTFALEQAMIQNDHAPDVVMAFRWNDSKNQFGVPGMIDADWQRAAGKGTHATLSRFDMHNTLIAAGPDFRRGVADDLPSGNVDLAPTILRILGIASLRQLDGRILSEAMTDSDPATATLKPENKMIEATKAFPSGSWRQSLQISRVGSTIYLDQGNGAFDAKR
ncbi:MAG TPA: alkaline phosphatase family protein [Candidatus Udaeobacter sp.]|jgi:predicted AlkP superfamily pyrophosphatase or phosphodiesterase